MTEYADTINERLMLDRIAELERQLVEAKKAAERTLIDEEHLTAEEWINLGWTHYRPINAPQEPA
jgi:hypothetical protein